MKNHLSRSAAIAALATSTFLSPEATASMSSAIDHGIEPNDYRDARRTWSQVKERISCRIRGEVFPNERRSFNADDFYLEQDTEVIVTYIYDGARARNTLGWYDARTPNEKRVIWRDASAGRTAPLEQGSKASLGVLPMGTELRFFLTVDGARSGELDLYQDASLNPSDANQVAARLFDANENAPFILGFEDRPNGGDQDFNDVIIEIELRPVEGPELYRVNAATGSAALVKQLGVSGDFTSVFSDPLSGELMLMNEAGNRLVQINPFTTATTSYLKTGLNGRKIERIAYAQGQETLYAYDRSQNEIIEMSLDNLYIGTLLELSRDKTLGDLIFDAVENRILYTTTDSLGINRLHEIANLSDTSSSSTIGTLSLNISGLAWSPENDLLAKDRDSTNIYQIDPYTGESILHGDTQQNVLWSDLTSTFQYVQGDDKAPMQLYSSGAEVITQHDNVVPGLDGIHSNRRGNGLASELIRQDMSGAEFEQFHELFYVPETATTLDFKVLKDYGSFKYHFGLFDYSVVDGLEPGSLEWRVTAAQNAISIFDDREVNPGDRLTIDAEAHGLRGKVICFFIVPNNRIDVFLRNPWRYTPKGNGTNTKRQPLFSLSAANPGQLDQSMAFSNGDATIFSFEDLTRYEGGTEPGWRSDNSFDDLTFSVTPSLQAVGTPNEIFMLKPAADDVRNRQTTADVNVDWDLVISELENLEPVDLNENTLLADSYVTITYLFGDVNSETKIGFADPDRIHERMTVFANAGAAALEADERGIGRSIGLGFRPAGAKLRFYAKSENGIHYTDPSFNSEDLVQHSAGRIPGTDIIVISLRDPDSGQDHYLVVSFELWDLQYSGDVRILEQNGDGTPDRGRNCY